MPHFYLHICNGHGDQVDHAGIDCIDARSAIAEAAMTAGEIMRDEMHDRLTDCRVRVTIETAEHDVIGTVDVSLSLNITT